MIWFEVSGDPWRGCGRFRMEAMQSELCRWVDRFARAQRDLTASKLDRWKRCRASHGALRERGLLMLVALIRAVLHRHGCGMMRRGRRLSGRHSQWQYQHRDQDQQLA